jgi:hypothetical protein
MLIVLACNMLPPTPANQGRPTATDTPPVRPSRTTQPDLPTASPTPTASEISSAFPCPQDAQSVDDIMTSCPTECELAWFNSDFDIEFDDAAGLPPLACENGLDPSGGVNPRLAIYQALRVMAALDFDQPLPWTEKNLYAWLNGAIDGILLTTTDMSHCCDGQNRIVLKADLLSQPAFATWYDQQYGIGLDVLVGLIVHEARHAEIGGHTCGSDDQTLQELGSWGVQHYLFTWLAEHTLGWLTPAQMQAALSHAQTALERICNP